MIKLLKKLLIKRDNSKKFDARVWIQLALLNKNLKSLKYYSRAIHIEIPIPPPIQRVTKPFLLSLLIIS